MKKLKNVNEDPVNKQGETVENAMDLVNVGIDGIADDDGVDNDEFMRLLQEFVERDLSDEADAERSQTMASDMTEGLALHEMDGGEYLLPAQEEPAFKGSSFLLSYKENDISLANYGNKLYLSDLTDGYLLFVALCLTPLSRSEGETAQDATLFIYREGQPEPICRQVLRREVDAGSCQVDVSVFARDGVGGRYYLLLSGTNPEKAGEGMVVGGSVFFPLDVLPPEAKGLRPAKVMEVRRIDGQLHSCQTLRMELLMDRKIERYETYGFCCYDSLLTTICDGKAMVDGGCGRGQLLTLASVVQLSLMEGGYTCVLAYEGEPFHKVCFTCDAGGCRQTDSAPIDAHSPEAQIGKLIMQDKRGWVEFSRQGSPESLKHRALERMQMNQVIENLDRFQIDCFHDKPNYLVYGQLSEDSMKQIASFFVQIQGSRPDFIDVASVSEPRYVGDDQREEHMKMDSHEMVCLYNVGALLIDEGFCLQKLRERLMGTYNKPTALFGTEAELEQLFEKAPYLHGSFPEVNQVQLADYTLPEVVHLLEWKLACGHLTLSDELRLQVIGKLKALQAEGRLGCWDAKRVSDFIAQGILPGYQRRMLQWNAYSGQERQLTVVEAMDANLELLSAADGASFEESMAALNRMVGLEGLKDDLCSLFECLRFNNLRRSKGIPVADEGTHHMLFLGNPGTGKTTVAKLMGRMLRATGILSKGEVVVAERASMVGRYIGETERNMRMLLTQARGNVLFIDEAYTLASDSASDKKDFGYRVIECLLTVLAQKHADMVVILAGYEAEMAKLLDTNPGLQGRFAHVFHFDDYKAEELMQAAEAVLAGKQYLLTDEAREYLMDNITEAVQAHDRHFSNVRWVEQYINSHIEPAMARRVMRRSAEGKDVDFCLIEREDIEEAHRHMKGRQIAAPQRRQRIGFIA